MANYNVTLKRFSGSIWDILYPKTTIQQVIDLSTTLANMQDDIDGKTDIGHQHDASAISSGVLADGRIPFLNASKINAGTFAEDRIPSLNFDTKLYAPTYKLGGVPRVLKSLFDMTRPDRTAFLPADQIIIEQSVDGGVTWIDAGVSDSNKRRLFTGQRPSIALPLIGGVKHVNAMVRITITGMKYNQASATGETDRYNYWNSTYVQSTERYCTFDEGWAWVGANSDRLWFRVERATGALPNSWTNVREGWMYGWDGGNYFSLDGQVFGGGTTQTTNAWNWRITFRTGTNNQNFNQAEMSTSYTTSAQRVLHLKFTGQNVWTAPNKLMYNDHLYGWDEYLNAEFPADVKANGTLLVKTNDSRLTDARNANDVYSWAKAQSLFYNENTLNSDLNNTAYLTKNWIGSVSVTLNAPNNVNGWYLIQNIRHRGGASDGNVNGYQIAVGMTVQQNRVFIRTQSGGSFSSWVEIYSTGSKPILNFSELTGIVDDAQLPYATATEKGAVRLVLSGSQLTIYTS